VRLRAPGDFAVFFPGEDAAASPPHQCATKRWLFIQAESFSGAAANTANGKEYHRVESPQSAWRNVL